MAKGILLDSESKEEREYREKLEELSVLAEIEEQEFIECSETVDWLLSSQEPPLSPEGLCGAAYALANFMVEKIWSMQTLTI